MKKAIWKTLKELGRIALFGAVGAVIAYVRELPYFEAILTSIVLLKAPDTLLHYIGKEKNIKSLKKGLTRF